MSVSFANEMRDARTLLQAIATFHPNRSPGTAEGNAWLDLDDLVRALADTDAASDDAARALLGVFERFPRHDGFEVFWTLLHHVEALPGYETELIASVRRVPNLMGLTMMRRLFDSGVARIDGVDVAALLRELTPQAPAIDFFVPPLA